jgi:hypothetical protein
LIREEYGIERGTICGVRWKKKEGGYGAWRIQAYWHEAGSMRTKVLGELDEVWSRITAKARKTPISGNASTLK